METQELLDELQRMKDALSPIHVKFIVARDAAQDGASLIQDLQERILGRQVELLRRQMEGTQ